MAIEAWIDAISRLFEISDGRGGTVKSYRVYEKDEFPGSLNQFPCAITYVVTWRPASGLGVGTPMKVLYGGVTEFHLTDGVDKSKIPSLLLYYARIRNAVTANLQLGGLVDDFRFATDRTAIQGPAELQYGNEAKHLGFVVNWEVKVDESHDAGYSPHI